jgi:hypothetical protein
MPMVRFVLSVLVAASLGLSCSMGLVGSRTGTPSHFNQSCGANCAAPIAPSSGEILAPAATRTGQVALERTVQFAEAVQGLITLERVLTGAELDRVERILKECVAQAHADINEAYQQREGGYRFENGKFPSDAECDRIVRFNEKGKRVLLAQELGSLKHAAAFACVKARLEKDFGGNFSVEPRYKGDPEANGVVLTNGGPDSLVPDLVVHATRNATDVQCVYEFKFPCLEKHRLAPLQSPGVVGQLRAYEKLTKRCPAALITPSGLKQLGIDG